MRTQAHDRDEILRAGTVVANLQHFTVGTLYEVAWAVGLDLPIRLTHLDGRVEEFRPPHDARQLFGLLRDAAAGRP